MKPIERGEILSLGEYETVRPHFRARVIEEKKRRRVSVGPNASAVFENRDTVLMQIQEMLRTERITREGAVLHEIETYNQLVPGPREVSATMMIEIDDRDTREKFLAEAVGIEAHISLVVDGERAKAVWDPERVLPGRASAVLYLKFPLSEKAAAVVRSGKGSIAWEVDHPHYQVRVPLSEANIKSLAEDFEAHAGA